MLRVLFVIRKRFLYNCAVFLTAFTKYELRKRMAKEGGSTNYESRIIAVGARVGGRKQYDPPGYLAVLRSADTSAEKKEAQLKSVKT